MSDCENFFSKKLLSKKEILNFIGGDDELHQSEYSINDDDSPPCKWKGDENVLDGHKFAENVLDGILVFYINVGNLSPINAEALVDKFKEKTQLEKILPSNYKIIWLAVREERTRLELLPLLRKGQ